MPLVLFNIGWMKYYRGQTRADRIFNGGKYVTDNETGSDIRNFEPFDGWCYGYVSAPHRKINMKRLGAAPDAEYVDEVTVVFTATRREGGGVVVGWYRDARVWRELQDQEQPRHYVARASEENCTLLKVEERVFDVPRASRPGVKFGMGISNTRYTDERKARPFVRKLRKYISSVEARKPGAVPDTPPGSGPRQSDPTRRARVEEAAINHVVAHYDGYECVSVESENKGWDLEFTRKGKKLLVEVKGRSGDIGQAELTPNEYAAMCNPENRGAYRLAIVTCALDEPRLSILKFHESDQTWRDQNDRKVGLKERTGVQVQVAKRGNPGTTARDGPRSRRGHSGPGRSLVPAIHPCVAQTLPSCETPPAVQYERHRLAKEHSFRSVDNPLKTSYTMIDHRRFILSSLFFVLKIHHPNKLAPDFIGFLALTGLP